MSNHGGIASERSTVVLREKRRPTVRWQRVCKRPVHDMLIVTWLSGIYRASNSASSSIQITPTRPNTKSPSRTLTASHRWGESVECLHQTPRATFGSRPVGTSEQQRISQNSNETIRVPLGGSSVSKDCSSCTKKVSHGRPTALLSRVRRWEHLLWTPKQLYLVGRYIAPKASNGLCSEHVRPFLGAMTILMKKLYLE